MKLNASIRVLLSVAFSMLPCCLGAFHRELPHSIDDIHRTKLYNPNDILMQVKTGLFSLTAPSQLLSNDNNMMLLAGYCMGCATWPSGPSPSMELALSSVPFTEEDEPPTDKQQQNMSTKLPLGSSSMGLALLPVPFSKEDEPPTVKQQQLSAKLPFVPRSHHQRRPIISQYKEGKSNPASRDVTCNYWQQIIQSLFLLGVAAFSFSRKPSKETDATIESMAGESEGMKAMIELASIEVELNGSIICTPAKIDGDVVDEKDYVNSQCDDAVIDDNGEVVESTSSNPAVTAASIPYKVNKTTEGGYSEENEMLDSFESFLFEVRHWLH